MPSVARRLFGTDEATVPARALRAGSQSLELRGGRLRHIRCGDLEVWHGLAFVLRDGDWGTPEPEFDSIDVRASADSFEARLEGRFVVGTTVDFRLRITGHTCGDIHVEVEAVPRADLMVNRLGLCLMHPLSVCGARVQVTHVDGRKSESTFPTLIPPWPPFTLVRALRHEWAPERWAQALLEGDVFETEDQRNNGDASFKTYSRSNMAPRPYRLGAGVPIRQAAHLRVETASASTSHKRSVKPLRVSVGRINGDWPAVGIEIRAGDACTPALHDEVRALQPSHLHMAWRPGDDVRWRSVATLTAAARARLRLDALLPPGCDSARMALEQLRGELDAANLAVEAVAVFPSHACNIDAARQILAPTRVGGGTPHFFVQLSRLDDVGTPDFVSFTTTSVLHGADDDDVMLGLRSLPDMVATWRQRHPALALRVGPSNISARSSPFGAQPPSDGTRRVALAAVDPRSGAQFGAAWALGHVAAFAGAGVPTISLLSLAGPSGVVDTGRRCFVRRPAFHLLSLLGRPARQLATDVSDPCRLTAAALVRGGWALLLVGNLTQAPVQVDLESVPADARVRLLDADAWPPGWRNARGGERVLTLAPYGVAAVRWRRPGGHIHAE